VAVPAAAPAKLPEPAPVDFAQLTAALAAAADEEDDEEDAAAGSSSGVTGILQKFLSPPRPKPRLRQLRAEVAALQAREEHMEARMRERAEASGRG
jgi:phage I-like protein